MLDILLKRLLICEVLVQGYLKALLAACNKTEANGAPKSPGSGSKPSATAHVDGPSSYKGRLCAPDALEGQCWTSF